jgi:hypothetical protein
MISQEYAHPFLSNALLSILYFLRKPESMLPSPGDAVRMYQDVAD